MAILISLVLRPVHRALCKARLPAPLAAFVLIGLVVAGLVVGFWHLAAPAGEWASTLDMEYAEERVKELFEPVKEMQKGIEDVAQRVDSIAETEEPETNEGESDGEKALAQEESPGNAGGVGAEEPSKKKKPVAVEIEKEPSSGALEYLQNFGIHAVATLLLIFFILSYGALFRENMIQTKGATEIFESLGHDVSAYLFTISAINAGLGICIAVAMWLMGMPNPILWGVMGMLLNYIPYLGALIGTGVVGLVAIVTFATPFEALAVPLAYFGLTALEGNVVTPMLIGKRFALNPIVVVVWFLAWGAMWGIAGMLIATPSLMGFKIVCANRPELRTIDRILSK